MTDVKRTGIFSPGERVDVIVSQVQPETETDLDILLRRVDQELYGFRRDAGLEEQPDESLTVDAIVVDEATGATAKLESSSRQSLMAAVSNGDQLPTVFLYEEGELFSLEGEERSDPLTSDDRGIQTANSMLSVLRTFALQQKRADSTPTDEQ